MSMIHARISYFHTIQSILKQPASWVFEFYVEIFPYYSVYFKAEPIILFLG